MRGNAAHKTASVDAILSFARVLQTLSKDYAFCQFLDVHSQLNHA